MKTIVMETELMSFPSEIDASPDIFLQNDRNVAIKIKVFENGKPYQLEGSLDMFFINPNKQTVTYSSNMSVSGNVATVSQIPSACFDSLGKVQFAIRHHYLNEITTLGVIRGVVYQSRI